MQFESQPPQYVYTKLSDMKVTMLAEAAKDARSRADQIASKSGCSVGGVRFARKCTSPQPLSQMLVPRGRGANARLILPLSLSRDTRKMGERDGG